MTAERDVNERHLTSQNFDLYLAQRVPAVLVLSGSPDASIFIEPIKAELGLRIEVGPRVQAMDTGMRNILSRIAVREGRRYFEVVVTLPTVFREAYPILCAIADRVQLKGASPAQSLRSTLEGMSSLLRPPESMSRERAVGLYGELLIVDGLISAIGEVEAVQSWRGGLAEEHDFGLPEFDLEVKTTTSERRVHWIESLTQLVPTQKRPLWLISHQITSAGAGEGRTLADLVDRITARLESLAVRTAFAQSLADSGWRDETRDQPPTRWTLRTKSSAYAVSGDFPRLTRDALQGAGFSFARIPEVRYRIDLEEFDSHQDPPKPIVHAISSEGAS